MGINVDGTTRKGRGDPHAEGETEPKQVRVRGLSSLKGGLALMIGVSVLLLGMAGCCPRNDDRGCPAGMVCNMANRIESIGVCTDPGEVNDPCDEDADCAMGLECEWQSSWTCKVSLGGPCEENEDCCAYLPPLQQSTCVFGECVQPARFGDPCDDDDDCFGGLSCHPSGQICT
jgi:hypothetical protein